MKNISLKEIYDRIKCREYDKYIEEHTSNVWKCYQEFVLPKLTDENLISKCNEVVSLHDASKWNTDEYDAYADHFYINPDNKDETEFNKAWLFHIHQNRHHWQFWVLMHDSGEKEPIDMPEEYIIEMICDWSSFQYMYEGSTANKWYFDNKDKMLLSDKTREILEKYLELCEGV